MENRTAAAWEALLGDCKVTVGLSCEHLNCQHHHELSTPQIVNTTNCQHHVNTTLWQNVALAKIDVNDPGAMGCALRRGAHRLRLTAIEVGDIVS